MNKVLQSFKCDFITNDKEVRVLGTYINPLFVAKDIAEILGYKDTDQSIRKHVDDADKILFENMLLQTELRDNKTNKNLDPVEITGSHKDIENTRVNETTGLNITNPVETTGLVNNEFHLHPRTILINESGLYKLLFSSKLPKAKEFTRWITSEVIPSIRKTGEYVNEELKKKLETLSEQHLDLQEKYRKKEENHNRMLYKRRRHKLKKGKCLYILTNPDNENIYKFGITKNLNSRTSSYNTYFEPDFKYIIFTNEHKLLEKCLKLKYRENLIKYDTEWLENVDITEVVKYIEEQAKILNIEYTIENGIENIIVEETKEKREKNVIETKEELTRLVCPKCKVEKDVDMFSKDRTNRTGYSSSCKVCEKEQKIKYKERVQQRMLENPITEKTCGICKETKPVSNYVKHLYTQDGWASNCKECCQKVKNRVRARDRENKVRYKCGICNEKEYSRKDVLANHLKTCGKN